MKWLRKKSTPEAKLALDQEIAVTFCGREYLGTINSMSTTFNGTGGTITIEVQGCLAVIK